MLFGPARAFRRLNLTGGDISKYTKGATEFSWVKFFMDNITLQVLVAAIVFGVLLSRYAGRERIIAWMNQLSKAVFWGLHKVMLLAPIGAFGGIAYTIGKYGLGTLLPLAKLWVRFIPPWRCLFSAFSA
jgi:aerobic C4-dicarboxylate transport protein